MSNEFKTNRTVSNTSSEIQLPGSDDQNYGIDVAEANSDLAADFGYQDITYSSRTGEGVLSGQLNGEDVWITSRQIVKTIDLLSEGEIEGIVSGEYVPSGYNPEGQLGYQYCAHQAYTQWPEAMLRSVYLNDVAIVNGNNQYNFQKAVISLSNGAPEGVREGDNFLKTRPNTLEKTLAINERLYGPDIVDEDSDGVTTAGPAKCT